MQIELHAAHIYGGEECVRACIKNIVDRIEIDSI